MANNTEFRAWNLMCRVVCMLAPKECCFLIEYLNMCSFRSSQGACLNIFIKFKIISIMSVAF